MKPALHPISLAYPPFFQDHHVGGRPVLAAMEAMELLAKNLCRRFPGHECRDLTEIRFDKFLYLEEKAPRHLFHETTRTGDGTLRTTLTTRFRSPNARIRRTLTHAGLTVGRGIPELPRYPMESAASLTNPCVRVDPDRIYRDMVPFGPAYRNIVTPLLISPDGALARVGSPVAQDPRADLLLGSPYVPDAALHACCVWCQRYHGIVTFPVSMDRRTVIRPTRMDDRYTARVVPKKIDGEIFWFDVHIYDDDGNLREWMTDVCMKDVSGGRLKPPDGFRQPAADAPLDTLAKHLRGLILVERDALAPFAEKALSEKEQRRLTPMVPDRAGEYLSARVALKRLSRRLSPEGDRRHAGDIETVAEDGVRPQCPLGDGTTPFCSVAHDRRFTIAVCADHRVGVDVEPENRSPGRALHLFTDADERAVIDSAGFDRTAGALRIWSVKEAAAKALGMDLSEAWERVRATMVASGCTRLSVDGEKPLSARHVSLEGHLFTLLEVLP